MIQDISNALQGSLQNTVGGKRRTMKRYFKGFRKHNSFRKNKEKLLTYRMLKETDYYAIHDEILWTYAVRLAMQPIRKYKPRAEIELGSFRYSLEEECLAMLAAELKVPVLEILDSRDNYKRRWT
jgi:hypothetical protein